MKFICENCGKEFNAKPSSNRKYCSRECATEASRGKAKPSLSKKVEVTCAYCGKKEMVPPCRAKNYVCCSTECSANYRKEQHLTQVKCTCPVCGKEFWVKPSRVKRTKGKICCSTECANILRQTTYSGEGNPQYGIKGEANASFKGEWISRKNNNLIDIFVYAPDRPDSNVYGRITKHRLLVLENYTKFYKGFFTEKDGFIVFNLDKELGICVHHINCNHSDNRIENLIPLTRTTHKWLHSQIDLLESSSFKKIIGVVKQGELLETPEVDNQQLSEDSNIFKSSETNNRIQTGNAEDSNIDTSALLNNINDIINDYIVQTRKITKDAYDKAVKEILESEIKNSEVNTNELS